MWYILASGILAALVLIDGAQRHVKSPHVWGLGTFLCAPLALAYYLSTRPLMVDEIRSGGIVWNLSRYFSIIWTALICMLMISELFFMNDHDGIMRSILRWSNLNLVSSTGLMMHAQMWLYPVVSTLVVGLTFRRRAAKEVGPTGPLAWSRPTADRPRSPFVIGASGH